MPAPAPSSDIDIHAIGLLNVATALAQRWRIVVGAPIFAGSLALGISFLIPPTYTAKTTFLPPQQQQQSSTASALASLGALAGLSGAGGIKTPGDQYLSLMQSVNVEDRIVDRFDLMHSYQTKYRFAARKELEQNVRMTLGKKDGIITVEVDDTDKDTAASIANQYVAELRRLISELALTEAQQRRVFFEAELKHTKLNLAQAQEALQSEGFNANALKAEPKAAADAFASIKAQATSAEVKLQTLQRRLTESTPEVQQQIAQLSALREQLAKLEQSDSEKPKADADYIGRYREFKYQEALYELFSKQYEMARLDESRDGALLQVIDVATPPERKSKPRRVFIAAGAAGAGALLTILWIVGGLALRRAHSDPTSINKLERLRSAWRRQ